MNQDDLPFSSSYWKLPKRYNLINGKVILLDLLKDDQISDAFSLVDQAKGKGLGMDEFLDKESFCNFIKRAVVFSLTEQNGTSYQLVGVWMYYPSPICRSFKTKMAAGYTILADSYRGKGPFQEIAMDLGMMWPLLGSEAMTLRMSRASSNELSSKYRSFMLSIGIIPKSQLVQSGERMDDVIEYSDLTAVFPRVGLDEKWKDGPIYKRLLSALEVHAKDTCFDRKFAIDFTPRFLKLTCGQSVTISNALEADIKLVNQMIYEASRNGNGFALDEFNHENRFAGRLLRKAAVLVAKDEQDTILAAAIFGPTNFCRSPSTDILGGYIIVNKLYRRNGIGKEFVQVLLAEAKAQTDFSGIIIDVFVTDIPSTLFVNSLKFRGIGQLVNSGTVAGFGVMSCSLMYYQLSRDVLEYSKI